MEKLVIKKNWENERKFLMYFRHLLLYVIFVLLALFTNVYNAGLVPNNFFNVLVIAGLILYRFITFAILPGIITYWLLSKGFDHATKR